MPRRPVSPDATTVGGKGKDKAKDKAKKDGAKGGDAVDIPVPTMDLDDKLIFDAHQAGLAAVDKIVSACSMTHTKIKFSPYFCCAVLSFLSFVCVFT